MTSRKPRKPSLRRVRLIERQLPDTTFVEFPHMQGRTVRKIEFSTSRGYHAFTIFFEGDTLLNIALEPLLMLRGRFSEVKSGIEHVVKEWPTITSISEKP